MVEKIVLVIDRDDDLGVKAGISSPVIGRENNVQAAVKLAISDPEDSDVNAIFAAVKLYDELKSKGEDVEIVTICGDKNVGVVSDDKISEQLDEVVFRLRAKSAIVVTDGSEDEYVLPIISSRLKIDGVHRVIVKQSKTIESTYFMIRKMLEDPKIAKMTLAPIGMIFIVYSIFLIFQHPELGLGGIVLFLGLYFLSKAYGWDKSFEEYFSSIKQSLIEGRFSFVLYVISVILTIIGLVHGFNLASLNLAPHERISAFIYGCVWWIIASGIFALAAKSIDVYFEGKSITRYVSMVFLLISFGFIVSGASAYMLSDVFRIEKPLYQLVTSVIAAMIIAVIGAIPLKFRSQH